MGPKVEAVINFLEAGGQQAFTNIQVLEQTFSGQVRNTIPISLND